MYTPEHFAETDIDRLYALINRSTLGTLVINGDSGLEANHIPFVHRPDDDGPGLLCAHIPRANPLSLSLQQEQRCLVIFNGPDGYVTPSWYATKQKHGRVVPTWNYSVVHAHGSAVVIDDPDWIMQQINELTDHNESPRPEPWAVSDAPPAFTKALVSSLVGLQVSVSRLEGKIKASQNQPESNKQSIAQAMSEEQPDSALSEMMRPVLGEPDG